MHIAVAGNIGAGKTTLTELLAKHYKWEPQYEDVVQNPYLDDFYAEMERLAKRIMAAFAEALGLENSYFDRFINNPISALRALHYPETNDFIIDKQQRAGAHTDYGSLTILLPQAGTSGLQIKKKNHSFHIFTIFLHQFRCKIR